MSIPQPPPGYNRLSIHRIGAAQVALAYVGWAGTNYALERTFNLSPANWVSLATNAAPANGKLVFTNTPAPGTNHFWRVRFSL